MPALNFKPGLWQTLGLNFEVGKNTRHRRDKRNRQLRGPRWDSPRQGGGICSSHKGLCYETPLSGRRPESDFSGLRFGGSRIRASAGPRQGLSGASARPDQGPAKPPARPCSAPAKPCRSPARAPARAPPARGPFRTGPAGGFGHRWPNSWEPPPHNFCSDLSPQAPGPTKRRNDPI